MIRLRRDAQQNGQVRLEGRPVELFDGDPGRGSASRRVFRRRPACAVRQRRDDAGVEKCGRVEYKAELEWT